MFYGILELRKIYHWYTLKIKTLRLFKDSQTHRYAEERDRKSTTGTYLKYMVIQLYG